MPVNKPVNKQNIQKRFGAARLSYDAVAMVQKQCAERLTALICDTCPDFYPASVLDLGTGTGYLPELLLPIFPKSQFTLNDISSDMLARAAEKLHAYPDIQCQVGDMETAAFASYDLIVSNLALQWVNQLEATLKAFYLRSNVLAFTCLLDGTFQEWEKLFHDKQAPSPLHRQPSSAELESFLLSLKPKISAFTIGEFRIRFESPRLFMRYLQQLGATVSSVDMSYTHLKQIVQSQDQVLDMTYRVFFGILKR